MSLLIKGMELPTSCYDCNCLIRDSDGSDYCCLLMLDIEDNDKRDDGCPLIPVPPHGRLIDADAPIPLVDAHGKNIEVTVAHIIENNFGIVNAIIESEGEND